MVTYSEIKISQLEKLFDNIPNIFDIKTEGDTVMFKYKDKDQDTVVVLINEIDDERVIAMMPLKMPDNRLLASMLAVNNWNQRKDSHGTFAYLANIDDEPYAIIESHLMLRGGADEENIRSWAKNLVNHINPFEEQVISALEEIGEDSKLLKTDGSDV